MIASGLQIYVVEEFSCRQLALSLIRPNMPRNVVMRTNLTNQMRLVSDYQRNKKELPVHRHKEPDAGSHGLIVNC